jgi:hypothetical protein
LALVELFKTVRHYWFELVELPLTGERGAMAEQEVSVLLVEDDEEDAS